MCKSFKRIYILIVLITNVVIGFAQANLIDKYEYWFDEDFNNASQISIASPSKDISIVKSLSAEGLTDGVHTFYFRAHSSDGLWSGVNGGLFLKNVLRYANPTNNKVTKAQYWIDADFEHAQTIATEQGKDAVFMPSISVNSITDGVHSLSVRFQDNNKVWSSVQQMIFLKHTRKDNDESTNNYIKSAQVWIDGDFNDAITTPINGGKDVQFTTALDINNYKDGLHFIHYRFLDVNGKWSSTEGAFFFKEDQYTRQNINKGITHFQYWLDNDYENAVINNVTTAANVYITNNISVDNLKDGLHTFNYRFKDYHDKWSSNSSSFFLKEDVGEGKQIKSCQYWFDNNFGQARSSLVESSNIVMLNEKIDANDLGDGLHILSYRFQDTEGVWSSSHCKFFFKEKDRMETNSQIVAYQYWLNSDYENAEFVTLGEPSNQVTIDDALDFHWTPKGDYIINYRFLDNNGKWSSVISDSITKISYPFVEFTATTIGRDCRNLTVAFDGRIVDGDVYVWNFDDNTATIDTTLTPEHAFAKGEYQVSLTIKDTVTLKENTFQLPVVFVPDVFRYEESKTVCGPYLWGGNTYTESGDYEHTFENTNGCDSIVSLHLTVGHDDFKELVDTVTIGSNYDKNGFIISADEINEVKTYNFELKETNVLGCDSLINLKLVVVSRQVVGTFEIFYNKSKNVMGIVIPTDASCQNIEFYDALGRKRYTVPIDASDEINVGNFIPGVYIVRCGTFVRKIFLK